MQQVAAITKVRSHFQRRRNVSIILLQFVSRLCSQRYNFELFYCLLKSWSFQFLLAHMAFRKLQLLPDLEFWPVFFTEIYFGRMVYLLWSSVLPFLKMVC